MAELSIFADESGETGPLSEYYLLTVVFHDQADDITRPISLYERTLRDKSLPDLPLHVGPLMTGHDQYEGMGLRERKQLLQTFFVMFQHLPVRYHTFCYRKAEHPDRLMLAARMRRDLVNLLFENLEWLQGFDHVKVYYDGGQRMITRVLHDAVEYAAASDAFIYRTASPRDYRLAQTADLICTLELTAMKYQAGGQTATDERFFGQWGSFKKNWLNKTRRKQL